MPSNEFFTVVRGKKTDRRLFDEALLDSERMNPDKIPDTGFEGFGEKLFRMLKFTKPEKFAVFMAKDRLSKFPGVTVFELRPGIFRFAHNSGAVLDSLLADLKRRKITFKVVRG